MDKLALIYVGDYSSIGGGAPLEWTSDTYRTVASEVTGRVTFAEYITPPGQTIGRFYYCDNLGRVFEEDETGEVAYIGYSIIVSAYQNMGDPGGGEREGKKITRVWSYVVAEDSPWRFELWPGNEFAFVPDGTLNQPLTVSPAGFSNYAIVGYRDSVAASRMESFPTTYNAINGRRVRHQPITVKEHNMKGVPAAGRGFTFAYIFTNPIGVEFIGLGGVYEPGDTSRPVYLVSAL